MRVISFREVAERTNLSVRTLQRQIAKGQGPAVTVISERRLGILEGDLEQWLLGRRRRPVDRVDHRAV